MSLQASAKEIDRIWWWRNLLTTHHRLMARYLRKRGWVVFYLEEEARHCYYSAQHDHYQGCWLHLYQEGEKREH